MLTETIDLFWESDFDSWAQARVRDLSNRIENEDDDYLLNVNEDQYLHHLLSEFSIDPLVLHFDSAQATDEERMIPAESFPSDVIRSARPELPETGIHLSRSNFGLSRYASPQAEPSSSMDHSGRIGTTAELDII